MSMFESAEEEFPRGIRDDDDKDELTPPPLPPQPPIPVSENEDALLGPAATDAAYSSIAACASSLNVYTQN